MERVCKFLKDAKTYYLATTDGDMPRVRPFGTAHIFEGKLYIQTGKKKAVSEQIMKNPKVEICAMNGGDWLRVSGELVEDDRREARVLTYRVPEYTKSGETALNRGVKYSDGTCIDGKSKGNLDDGTPGVDAYYTSYHWTKVVCQTCGTINSGDGPLDYNLNNNVYSLNPCDHNFFLDFDATTYAQYDVDYHLTTLKRGEYCKFCKGTFARATRGLENHDFSESIDA